MNERRLGIVAIVLVILAVCAVLAVLSVLLGITAEPETVIQRLFDFVFGS